MRPSKDFFSFVSGLINPLKKKGMNIKIKSVFFNGDFDYFNISVAELKKLIATGIELNQKDQQQRTPLMYLASSNCNPQVIEVMITAGARVNETDIMGRTPLMMAARYNKNPLILEELIKHGAIIDQTDLRRKTALMLAAANNENPQIIETLLEKGANGRLKDSQGLTAFGHLKKSYNSVLRKSPAFYMLKRGEQSKKNPPATTKITDLRDVMNS